MKTPDSQMTDFSDSHFLTKQDGQVGNLLSAEMAGEAQAYVRLAITGDTFSLSLTQARQFGKWLCARADEFEPVTPIAKIKRAIRWRLAR
jgi:hypothetical protein